MITYRNDNFIFIPVNYCMWKIDHYHIKGAEEYNKIKMLIKQLELMDKYKFQITSEKLKKYLNSIKNITYYYNLNEFIDLDYTTLDDFTKKKYDLTNDIMRYYFQDVEKKTKNKEFVNIKNETIELINNSYSDYYYGENINYADFKNYIMNMYEKEKVYKKKK